MLQKLFTIARNTFLESVRQPVFAWLLIVSFLAIWLIPQLAAYTMEDDNKMLIDMGLSTLLLAGVMIAAFTATRVLTAELENKTVLTVVSKPVSRAVFVVGKYLGVAAAMALAVWIISADFLLVIRHRVMATAADEIDWPVLLFGWGSLIAALLFAALTNYYYNWVFNSTFVFTFAALNTLAVVLVLLIGKHWEFQPITVEFARDDWRLAKVCMAILLVLEAQLILCAVAIAASTRLGQVMTILVCFGVAVVSMLSDSFFHHFTQGQSFAQVEGFWQSVGWIVFTVIYWVVPNLQFLWLADDLTQGHTITANYILWVTAYSAVFVTAILCLAVALFQTREIS